MKRFRFLVLLFAAHCSCAGHAATTLWTSFVEARAEGHEPILPDFSYAGYHFLECPLPKLDTHRVYDVTDFGALPNDGKTDEEAIQAAVDAAEAVGGGVVLFPPGRFVVSGDSERHKHIRISCSNIVLKGSGSGPDGTEVFLDKMRIGQRQFVFQPDSLSSRTLTRVVGDAPREGFWVRVADGDALSVGQVVVLTHQSEAYTRLYFHPRSLSLEWTRLLGSRGGMKIQEIHTVAEIDGDRVCFENPIHFPLRQVGEEPFELTSFPAIEECGIEGICFTSNWKNHPESFVHHKNGVHDSGWCAVTMQYVKDCWVRDCEFSSLNEALTIKKGYRVTVTDTHFTGKKGHTSIHARSGYGVLIKKCTFNGSHHHGPGGGYGSVNLVVTQCSMGVDQNIDSHSGQPMATLFDDIHGGVFRNCGGPLAGLPHHGRDLVFWNFRHRSKSDYNYNFWSIARRRNHTFADPIFVGFQADSHVTFENEGVNESPGHDAEPISLFEAQLKLRLGKKESLSDRCNRSGAKH